MAINLPIVSKFDDKGIKQAQAGLGSLGRNIGRGFAVATAAVAAAGAGLVAFGTSVAKEAENALIAQRRLDQVAESMGIFGDQAAATSRRLGDYAEKQELIVGVDAEVIKATQAKLLTFKELAKTAGTVGGSMDRATKAALDLAATGFGTAETNAIQLGKALQDPIKGINSLARAGVTFTAQEKENIKTLVESGKTLEAQNLILKAIETQVGGTSEATVSGFNLMKISMDNLKEQVGMALMPALDGLFKSFSQNLLPIMTDIAEKVGPVLAGVIENLTKFIKDATDPSTKLGGTFKDMADKAKAVFDRVSEIVAEALPGLQRMFENVKGPIEDVLGFLGTLGEVVLVAVKDLITNEGFQKAFERVAKSVGDFAREAGRLAKSDLVKFLTDISTTTITGGLTVLGNALKIIAGALSAINNTMDALKGKKLSWDQILPSLNIIPIDWENLIKGFMPKFLPNSGVPKFATGGIVPARAGGTLGIIGEAGQAEAVIPLNRLEKMIGGKGNSYNITVNAGMGSDGNSIGRKIIDEILRFERSSGQVFARA